MSFDYCPLFSGSSGNAALLGSESTRILVDAGLSGKAIAAALENVGQAPERLKGILITHEHSDHVKAAGILSRKYNLPIYANAQTWAAMEVSLGKLENKNIRVFQTGHDFFIGDIEVFPYAVSHDAAEPVGFVFTHKGKSVAQMTDLGTVDRGILDIVSHTQLVLVESNHDIDKLKKGPYPQYLKKRILSHKGHLSNVDAGKTCVALAKMGLRRFILGHLSNENNNETLAKHAVDSALQDAGLTVGERCDVQVYMAHRDRACAVFHLA